MSRDAGHVESRRAGRSSQQKYDELTRSWRRRHLALFAWLGLVCGGVAIATFVLSRYLSSAAWSLGFLGGCAVALWIIARLSPPTWIENWQTGSWGEQSTGKVLRTLERQGWLVLHDLPEGTGNIDHIVIGPPGVFLLDSKRLGGVVSIDERGRVDVRRIDDPDLGYHFTGTDHVVALAARTHDRIRVSRRMNIWVTPVVVLWAEFPQGVVQGRRCSYVGGEALVDWLRSQPEQIAANRFAQVAEAVVASFASE